MKILGSGSYVPNEVETNLDLIDKGIDTTNEWILSKTGIKERPISKIPVSEMAKIACEIALKKSRISPEDIELIILATSTPDMLIPCCSSSLQKKIKAKNSAVFDLNNACSGFVYSLDIASKYIQTRTYEKIMVVGADWSSKITNPFDRNTVVFFADGAGAVIVGKEDFKSNFLSSYLACEGDISPIFIPSGGCLDRFHNNFNNEDFYLKMEGKKIWNFVIKVFSKTLNELCKKAKIKIDDIDWIVPHQPNKILLEEAAKVSKIPIEKVIINVENRGNTIAASIPIALDEAIGNSKIKRGDIVALMGFGAGLSWGGVLIRY